MRRSATEFYHVLSCLALLVVGVRAYSGDGEDGTDDEYTGPEDLYNTMDLSSVTPYENADSQLTTSFSPRSKRGEVDTILLVLYDDYYTPNYACVNPRRRLLRNYLNSIRSYGWNATTVFYSTNIVQYASVGFLKDLVDQDMFPRTTLEALDGENCTYGQVLALDRAVLSEYTSDQRHFCIDDIVQLPTGFMRLVPADDIYDLHDEIAFENMEAFNMASEKMLISQRASYVRKLQGVPLANQMIKCGMASGISDVDVFNAFIPNAQFLEWIPFNNYMNLSLTQLNFYIQKLPYHSAQTMLYMQKLFNCPFKDLRELATPKFLMSLTCEYILKVNMMDVRYILEAFDKLPEPYAIDFQIINCLHTIFVSYMNITLAGNRARTEVQLLNIASQELIESAGGLVIATMRSESIGNLTKARCLRTINYIGRQPLYRLQMVKPRNSLYSFVEIALRCANIYPKHIDEDFIDLLGSLTHYLFPRYFEHMKPTVFEFSLPRLLGMAKYEQVFLVPCQDEPLMTSLQQKLIDVYGLTETWDSATIRKVSCLMYVLDDSELDGLNSDLLYENMDLLDRCYLAIRRHSEYHRTQMFLDGICYDDIGNQQFYRQNKMDHLQERFSKAFKDHYGWWRNDSTGLCETYGHPVSCLAFQEIGSARFAELDEIRDFTSDEFEECTDWMGAMMIHDEVAEEIWDRMKTVYGSARDVPRDIKLQLGSIVRGIPIEDFSEFDFCDLTMVGEFGRNGLWGEKDYHKLRAMARVVKRLYKWDIRSYTGWDFLALGQVTCGFSECDLRRISIRSFADGLSAFASLACPADVMAIFRDKLVHPNVLGPTSQWGPGTVRAAGTLLAGLTQSDVQAIRSCAITGVSLTAARNMLPEAFYLFTERQLRSFTPEVAYNIPASTYLQLPCNIRQTLLAARRNIRPTDLSECIGFRWDIFTGSLTHDDAYDCFNPTVLSCYSHSIRHFCGWLLPLVLCALSIALH